MLSKLFRRPADASSSLYVELVSRHHDHDADVALDVGVPQRTSELSKLPSHLLIHVFQYLDSPIKAAGVFTSLLSRNIQERCSKNRGLLIHWMFQENKRVLAANISANKKLMEDNPEIFDLGADDQAAQLVWIKEHYPKLNLLLFGYHLDKVITVVFLLAMLTILLIGPNSADFDDCMEKIWRDKCSQSASNWYSGSVLCTGIQHHTIDWGQRVFHRSGTRFNPRGGSYTVVDDQEFAAECIGYASPPLHPLIAVPLAVLLFVGALLTVYTALPGATPGCNLARSKVIIAAVVKHFKNTSLLDERLPIPVSWPLFAALLGSIRTEETKQASMHEIERESKIPSGFRIV